MTLAQDVNGIGTVTRVELFEFDATAQGATEILRWHPGTTISGGPVVWQGETYEPLSIEAAGFARNASGTLPRPTLRVSNIGGLVGQYLRAISDGLGAKVTRRRTLAKYLDAINFDDGNPYADPTAAFPDEIYYLARKSLENALYVEVELAVKFDVSGVRLPRRQVIAATCQWVYRSAECSYAGPPVEDIYGNPTTDLAEDQCRKSLSACKARFGENGVLRTSAFPSSTLGRA